MKTVMEIEPAYEAALRAARLADFDAVMQTSGVVRVTSHRHRETVRMEIAVEGRRTVLFLKRVFRAPPKHAFWPLFRLRLGRSQPYREWHMLGELDRAGLPAMRRVAFGERRRLGMPASAFLLVEAAPMEYTIQNWLIPGFARPPTWGVHLRRRLIFELGGLIGRLHARGFTWPDLHAKHIFAAPLVGHEPKHAWAFLLIDVERMTRMWPSSARACDVRLGDGMVRRLAGELLAFRRSLRPLGVTGWELRRFLAGYRAAVSEQPSPLDPGFLFSTLAAAGSPRDAGEIEKPPRLPDDYEHPACTPFADFEHWDQDLCMRMDVRASRFLLPPKDVTFQELLDSAAGRPMDKPGLEQHRRRVRLDFGEKAFYLKRYDRPPPATQLRRIWESKAKRSTAWREFHFIKRLGEVGISTAKPIAFSEKMAGPYECRSLLITEEINGVSLETLTQEMDADLGRRPPWPQRREIIEQLAAVAREMHGSSLFHRDFYLCHVFLTHNRDGEVVLRVIDLARMIENPRRPSRWRIKDLAALNYSAPSPLITKTDRLRFLYRYLPRHDSVQGGSSRSDQAARKQHLRYIIRRVEARSRRMARHDAGRERRLRERTKA